MRSEKSILRIHISMIIILCIYATYVWPWKNKDVNTLSWFVTFKNKNICSIHAGIHCPPASCSLSQSASGLLCQRTHAHRAKGVHGVRHSSDEGWQPQEPSDVRIPVLDDRAQDGTEGVDNHDDHMILVPSGIPSKWPWTWRISGGLY